jgi:hypothetical protein
MPGKYSGHIAGDAGAAAIIADLDNADGDNLAPDKPTGHGGESLPESVAAGKSFGFAELRRAGIAVATISSLSVDGQSN